MRIDVIDGTRVLFFDATGPAIAAPGDANDLIGEAWGHEATFIVIPVERLAPAFFQLRSLLAGDIIQKIVTYRLRVAIIGDISGYVAASDALRDFVWESNRGTQVWFLSDEAALIARIVKA
jgi:hypothetical protein